MLSTPIETLQARFGFAGGLAYPPRPSIRPGEPVAVLRLQPGIEATGKRELALVRWGLIPHWVKNPQEFGTLVNARAETLAEKPSFKAALRHRRCLVPADGWYVSSGKPRHRVAHLVQPGLGSIAPFVLAALWDHWLGSDGSEIETLAIITGPAAGDLAQLDDRMPLPLSATAADAWLDVRGVDVSAALALLKATDGPSTTATPLQAAPDHA